LRIVEAVYSRCRGARYGCRSSIICCGERANFPVPELWSTAAHIALSSEGARGRVAHLLVSLASAIGEATPDGVEMQITNEDLAEGANVTAFTVIRCLSDWRRAGILTKRRGKILLRKPELLLAG
jgi:hypothetical protein